MRSSCPHLNATSSPLSDSGVTAGEKQNDMLPLNNQRQLPLLEEKWEDPKKVIFPSNKGAGQQNTEFGECIKNLKLK